MNTRGSSGSGAEKQNCCSPPMLPLISKVRFWLTVVVSHLLIATRPDPDKSSLQVKGEGSRGGKGSQSSPGKDLFPPSCCSLRESKGWGLAILLVLPSNPHKRHWEDLFLKSTGVASIILGYINLQCIFKSSVFSQVCTKSCYWLQFLNPGIHR